VNVIRFDQARDSILVTDTARDATSREITGTGTTSVAGRLSWRTIAEFVGVQEWAGGLSQEGLVGEPTIEGLTGWEAAAVLLCWRRFGLHDQSVAADLLSKSDANIRLLLTVMSWRTVADDLIRVDRNRSKAALDSSSVADLLREFGIRASERCLAQLGDRLQYGVTDD